MDLPLSESFLRRLTGRESTEEGDRIPRLKDFLEIYPEQGEFFLRCLEYLDYAKADNLTAKERAQLEVKMFSSKLEDLCLTMEFPAITTVGLGSITLMGGYARRG